MKIIGNVELNKNSKIENLSIDSGPELPAFNEKAGFIFFNTSTKKLYVTDDDSWEQIINNGLKIPLTGDVIGEIVLGSANPTNVLLSSVCTTPGLFGSASTIPVLRVGADGRISEISQLPITSLGSNSIAQTVTTSIGQYVGTSLMSNSTLPTITSGSQIASLNITPLHTTSRVLLSYSFTYDISDGEHIMTLALFRNNTCINVSFVSSADPKGCNTRSFSYVDIPNNNLPLTYTIRVGTSKKSSIWYINYFENMPLNMASAMSTAFVAQEIL